MDPSISSSRYVRAYGVDMPKVKRSQPTVQPWDVSTLNQSAIKKLSAALLSPVLVAVHALEKALCWLGYEEGEEQADTHALNFLTSSSSSLISASSG